MKGTVDMIRALRSDPQRAKTLAIQFIRKYNERIDAGEVADSELKSVLKPVKLAFELNEILVPWKKYTRLIHKGRTTKKDREYFLGEVRLLLSRASPTLRVVILIMCSCGIRVGAFDYLKVGDILPSAVSGASMISYGRNLAVGTPRLSLAVSTAFLSDPSITLHCASIMPEELGMLSRETPFSRQAEKHYRIVLSPMS